MVLVPGGILDGELRHLVLLIGWGNSVGGLFELSYLGGIDDELHQRSRTRKLGFDKYDRLDLHFVVVGTRISTENYGCKPRCVVEYIVDMPYANIQQLRPPCPLVQLHR